MSTKLNSLGMTNACQLLMTIISDKRSHVHPCSVFFFTLLFVRNHAYMYSHGIAMIPFYNWQEQ